jgi:hypothetical protein
MQKTHKMKLYSPEDQTLIFDGFVVRLSDSSFSFIEKDQPTPSEKSLLSFFTLKDLQSKITVPSEITKLH